MADGMQPRSERSPLNQTLEDAGIYVGGMYERLEERNVFNVERLQGEGSLGRARRVLSRLGREDNLGSAMRGGVEEARQINALYMSGSISYEQARGRLISAHGGEVTGIRALVQGDIRRFLTSPSYSGGSAFSANPAPINSTRAQNLGLPPRSNK